MWPQYDVRGGAPMRAVHWSSTQQHSAVGNSARKEGGREGGREEEKKGGSGGRGRRGREGGGEERKEYINEGDVKMVWFVTQTCEGMLWPCWLPASSPTASRNERTA